jgi:hypothetical protein
MGRVVAGVVAGYVTLVAAVMVALSIAYFTIGADRAFRPGSYDVTGLWLVVSTVLSMGAAVLGGWLAVRVGRTMRAPVSLAIVVVVAGIVLALPTLNAPPSGEVRTSDVGNTEAMMKAQQPPAVSILNPIIGGIGVMIGARLRRPS